LLAVALSSCATILNGKVTTQQRTKPAPGEPQRKVYVGWLLADIFLTGGVGLIVDFPTGAIYKRESENSSKK